MIWWTPFTGDEGLQQCGEYQCYVTNDRGVRDHPNTRAIFFYGTAFKAKDIPLPRRQHENWALMHEESPKNNPIFSHPEMMRHFNFTSTFSRKSSFPLTSQYLESIEFLTTARYLVTLEEKNRLQKMEGLAPVAYIQSGCDSPSMRDEWVTEFMKYIKVDSYGSCLNNKRIPSDLQGSEKFESDKFYNYLARYKFVISFENAICNDYVTEKLWRTIATGSVPIYLGAPNIESILPNKKSAILVKEFNSSFEVAEYVNKINGDDELYKSFLQHKELYNPNSYNLVTNTELVDLVNSRQWGVSSEQQRWQGNMVAHYQCHVCQRLSRNLKYSNLGIIQFQNDRLSFNFSGFRPLLFAAGAEDYGCSAPVSPLSGETLPPKSWWGQQWLRSKHEAVILDRFALENIPIDEKIFYAETFEMMQSELKKKL